MIVMALGAVLLLGVGSVAQDAKQVASPSDVPVDKIKKATGTQDAATQDADKPTAKTDAAKPDSAKTDAAKQDTAKTDAAKTDAAKSDAPKPVAEGTKVDQPDCQTSACNECDPCNRKGRLMSRVRSLFSRRCCR